MKTMHAEYRTDIARLTEQAVSSALISLSGARRITPAMVAILGASQ